jgi:hypothetical protein
MRSTPRSTPPLTYRLARWRHDWLVTIVGWLAAVAVLVGAGFVVGSV